MIIIMGDSWGVGEWSSDKDRGLCLSGPGIGQFFSLHSKVINLSQGASDNFTQQKEFELLLLKYNPDTTDQFYWIVTDPLRNVTPDGLLKTAVSIKSAVAGVLDSFLCNINAIAAKRNITINLIGGLCDLEPVSYSNLKVVVPSWCKMFNANHTSSIFVDHTIQNLASYITTHRPDLKHEWVDLVNIALAKRQSFDYLESCGMFQCNHPTVLAHKLLRDFLSPINKHLY